MADQELQIQARTQQLVAMQIGELVMTVARLRAEVEIAAAIERRGRPDGAQGADDSVTQDSDHG
jgi:hypothetical protein